MKARFSKGLVTIIIASLLMGLVALPDSVKTNWPDNRVVNWFKNPKVTLGLDLQGGTQLDYRIDLRNAEEKNADEDPNNDVVIRDVIEGVRTTIERRVNGLGVSEPNIFLSNVGGEQHIVVELAGIKDIEEAKAIVGKTIQLEFMEPKTEADPDRKAQVEAEADEALKQLLSGEREFVELGKSIQTSDNSLQFREALTNFETQIAAPKLELLKKLSPGEVNKEVVADTDGYVVNSNGQLTERNGLFITQLVSTEVKDRTITKTDSLVDLEEALGVKAVESFDQLYEDLNPDVADVIWPLDGGTYTPVLEVGDDLHLYRVFSKTKGADEVTASHILISYNGAERANPNVDRQKEDAYIKAQEVLEEVQANPNQFAKLAEENSDGPSATKGGDLGTFGRGQMTAAFEEAAFSTPAGEVTDVVETEFGYHIIQVNDRQQTEDRVGLQLLKLPNTEENREKMEAALKRTEGYETTVQEAEYVYNELFFDLTPNPWKPTGLDGAHFKYATVTYSHIGAPQVSIEFDNEGGKMFEDLTDRLSGQQMAIFVGGELVSAPRVNEKISGGAAVITGNFNLQEALQLANDLNTGAIDAPIILTGQYTISATLGENALRVSLWAGLIGLILLAIFMVLYYRLLGLIAVVALLIYSVIIVFILKTTGIVMTLAGIAGIILSIGMAVDANILIFERTREELNNGKNFLTSVSTGFERAWSSIRDSNVSSLITCAILYLFGNSIIRGFALMLAIGIIISMFTAITVTRSFLRASNGTALTRNRFLLGAKDLEA